MSWVSCGVSGDDIRLSMSNGRFFLVHKSILRSYALWKHTRFNSDLSFNAILINLQTTHYFTNVTLNLQLCLSYYYLIHIIFVERDVHN